MTDITAKTTVAHVNDHIPGSVYIGRRNARYKLAQSVWANPFPVGPNMTRADAIIKFEEHLARHPELWRRLPELRGKVLACWCRHHGEEVNDNNRCHGDVLANLLNHHSDEHLVALSRRHD